MASFPNLFSKLADDDGRKGRQFEHVCKWFLQNDPEYKRELKRVWLWNEWPQRWGRDKGIDLVAEAFDGKHWAIQAKAYAPQHSITKNDVDRFLSESSRELISYRLLITSAAELGHNAKEAIEGQEKKVGYLLLSDLKKRNLNWPSSPEKLLAKQVGPRNPRPDQREAIADVLRGFRKHDRGQLIRACGTGKTLIGLRIAEAMNARRTLVLVPSLSLISQILRDWTGDGLRPFRFLPVCSDDTVRGEDHLVSRTNELGVPATTDPSEVAEFLQGSGTRVIFSTYQSTPIIAAAYERHKLPPFDLAIADEAHRCAGVQTGAFATILDSWKIRCRKRLFMTATPRYLAEAVKNKADEMELEVASMDDHEVFGPVFHELKFSEAIRRKLLTDYRVVIVGVDDPMYRQYAEEGVFVTLDGKRITDARTLASHIAVAKATKRYDLRRIITFHGRVKRAREFAEEFPQFVRWMPKSAIPAGKFWAELISGEMASSKRDAILDRLRDVEAPERGLVSNARCLSEGVDVRALDGVAFIDPKESQVDIIQAVGRAIRKAERKKVGIIILPVYISSGENAEKNLEDSAFKQVWRVLRALRSHDDRLADELDSIRTKIGKGKRVRAYLPGKFTVDLPERLDTRFVDAFYLRTVQSITPPPRLTVEQILLWADLHHRKTGQWPTTKSGEVIGAERESWNNINNALQSGLRGLPGGSSLPRLLNEERGVRNRKALPPLTTKLVLAWADSHYRKTGQWPKHKSGRVIGVEGEDWRDIDQALRIGIRGLPKGSSLARLLSETRGVPNQLSLPPLKTSTIIRWADAYHRKTGQWPKQNSGKVTGTEWENWANINAALNLGRRGLSGGSSIAGLLSEKRGVRNVGTLPPLTTKTILAWADLHHRKTGRWPRISSGKVIGTDGENWTNIDAVLRSGHRGLPGRSSLPQLLSEKRGVPNSLSLPPLTKMTILSWADRHHRKTGQWPIASSGKVTGVEGMNWNKVENSLRVGGRGLPGGSSLARLLNEKRGVRNKAALPPLTTKIILRWANRHYRKTGKWPTRNSGKVIGTDGEDWSDIRQALRKGLRGLPGGSSIAQLLSQERGV